MYVPNEVIVDVVGYLFPERGGISQKKDSRFSKSTKLTDKVVQVPEGRASSQGGTYKL